MAAKTVGTLIKEARSKAGLSQTALAAMVEGVSASDIGKAERGEKQLSQEALRAIARATGVTQKSLLEAPQGGAAAEKTSSSTAKKASSSTAKKTSSASTAKKTSSSTAKKTSSSTAKKTADAELTSAEKTLLNTYRKADSETRKAALSLLKGENEVIVSMLLKNLAGNMGAGANGGALSGLMGMLGNLGKK